MSKIKHSGICKLTLSFGPFVDSHIIPLALTRLSRTGEKYVEAGIGLGLKRRSNSWYDRTLVTRQGEDILADIDSQAIKELRAHRLVWSGWQAEQHLQSDDIHYIDGTPIYRLIKFEQSEVLRIFFLSLLWRAAASTRPEFEAIILQDSALEDLRNRILNQEAGSAKDFPIQLFQIISRGVEHNRVPLLERKPVIDINGSTYEDVTYVRFYFDGLVAHIHIPNGQKFCPHYLMTFLGCQDDSIVFIHEYDDSRASANIKEMASVVRQEQISPNFPLNATTLAIQYELPE